MIPITQTKVVVKNSKGEMVVRGNCYAAAIASMLELPITEVPNGEVFFDDIEDSMFYESLMKRFLKNRGLQLRKDFRFAAFHENDYYKGEQKEKLKEEMKDILYLATGKSARGVYHICIFKNGELVHDPHPTREGITDIIEWEIIEPLKT